MDVLVPSLCRLSWEFLTLLQTRIHSAILLLAGLLANLAELILFTDSALLGYCQTLQFLVR